MTNPTIADTLAYFRAEKQRIATQLSHTTPHLSYYDMAILALDTFESRRCRNCQYYYKGCCSDGSIGDLTERTPDDYCSHFEEKETNQ